MLKRISSLLIAFLLCACPALANDNINAVFDTTDFSINISGTAQGLTSQSMTVVVADNDQAVSADNLPVYSYLHKVNADKSFDISLLVSKALKSGKAYIFLDGKGFHEKTTVFVFNPSDPVTVEKCGEAILISNEDKFLEFLSENASVMGINLEDAYISENFEALSDVLFYEKDTLASSNPADFYDCMTKCLAYVMIKNGADIGDVVADYSKALGITLEEYNEMSDTVKDNYASIVRNSDNKTNSIPKILSESIVLANIISAENWSDLEGLMEKYEDVIGIDMSSGSDFDEIPSKKQYKVFVEIYDEIDSLTALPKVKDAFDDAVKAIIKETNKSSGSSSGGSSFSGGSSSGGSAIYVPESYVENIPVAPIVPASPVFSDISEHFAKGSIEALAKSGKLNGYEDGTFRPNGLITRAEFCTMLVKALNIEQAGEVKFEDVDSSSWYHTYVNIMASKGFVSGYNGFFNPENPITRQDAAVILSNILKANGLDKSDSSLSYSDTSLISDYASASVANVSGNEIMKGDESGFRPLSSITRGEAAITIERVLSLLNI